MSLLVNATGHPEPPTDLVRRLRQIDDRLSLRFYPLGENGGQWALIERWTENDRRRQMIQRGEMSPESDFDLVGLLPLAVRSEDALPYIEKSLVQRPQTKDDYQAMLSKVRHYNDDVAQERMDDVKAFGRELVDANKHTILGNAKSYGGITTDASGTITARPGRKQAKKGLTKSERAAIMDVGA